MLSDVTNPLLGPRGAAAVFGPQKGADRGRRSSRSTPGSRGSPRSSTVDPATPGAGAAGGTGFGLLAWGARARAGLGRGRRPHRTARGGGRGIRRRHGRGIVRRAVRRRQGARARRRARRRGRQCRSRSSRAGSPPDADISAFAGTVSLTELAGSSAAAIADPARGFSRPARRLHGISASPPSTGDRPALEPRTLQPPRPAPNPPILAETTELERVKRVGSRREGGLGEESGDDGLRGRRAQASTGDRPTLQPPHPPAVPPSSRPALQPPRPPAVPPTATPSHAESTHSCRDHRVEARQTSGFAQKGWSRRR